MEHDLDFQVLVKDSTGKNLLILTVWIDSSSLHYLWVVQHCKLYFTRILEPGLPVDLSHSLVDTDSGKNELDVKLLDTVQRRSAISAEKKLLHSLSGY